MPELLAPCFRMHIGSYRIERVTGYRVQSARFRPMDRAVIWLDGWGVPGEGFRRGDPVRIWQGYREHGLWEIFRGEVTDTMPGRIYRVEASGPLLGLRRTRITQAFVDARPHEIARFVLERAGVADYHLGGSPRPAKHQFVLAGTPGTVAFSLLNRSWGLVDWAYYAGDGRPERFYWGPWENSARYAEGVVAELEWGRNITDLVPSDYETGVVETVGLPWVRHSHRIRIRARPFWRSQVTVRVERVEHTFGKVDNHRDERVRTEMEWRIVASS